MIDSKFLEKRFGIDVILQNLSPEEKYLCVNKNILNDSSVAKIDHLQNSMFDNSRSLLKFVSEVLDTDINLDNENFPVAINELLKIFSDYLVINPYFDVDNIETWCDEASNVFAKCGSILDGCGMLVQNTSTLCEASNVSDERIRENIYNDLDDNSILLLYGLLTGSYPPYNPEMRNTVYNDIKNNRERSRIGSIVLHSLKENESENIGSILDEYDLDTCRMAQTNGTVLIDELGTIKSISKVGDNKYSVCVLNTNDNYTNDDVSMIKNIGSVEEFKSGLNENSSMTPDDYAMNVFDTMFNASTDTFKKYYNTIKDTHPDLAKRVIEKYGDDFLKN